MCCITRSPASSSNLPTFSLVFSLSLQDLGMPFRLPLAPLTRFSSRYLQALMARILLQPSTPLTHQLCHKGTVLADIQIMVKQVPRLLFCTKNSVRGPCRVKRVTASSAGGIPAGCRARAVRFAQTFWGHGVQRLEETCEAHPGMSLGRSNGRRSDRLHLDRAGSNME